MRPAIAFSILLLAVPAFVAPASAGECSPMEPLPVLAVGSGDATVYVDIRDTGGSIWIYQESNHVPGLQRGGSAPLSDDSNCAEWWNPDYVPDTLIF